jgi:hypothetical protein
VRSKPRPARTILLFHIISTRPSKQPRMVGSTLGVYTFGLIFVSVRTNKRHHHHVVCGTRSAHEGSPSGMLFNDQHGSPSGMLFNDQHLLFIFFKSSFSSWLLHPEPITHVRGVKGARTSEERILTRNRSSTRRGHLLLTAYQTADCHQLYCVFLLLVALRGNNEVDNETGTIVSTPSTSRPRDKLPSPLTGPLALP